MVSLTCIKDKKQEYYLIKQWLKMIKGVKKVENVK